jgi:diguanylate cyclase (GGDEF)-like protein
MTRSALACLRSLLLSSLLLAAAADHCLAQLVASAGPAARLALTAEEQAYLARLEQLTICTFPDWMPYEQITDSGGYRGIGADLTALLAEQLGVPITRLPTRTWSESLANVRDGRCQMLPMTMDVPSRRSYLDYSAPFTSQPFVIATRRSGPFVANLAQLDDARIAVVEGFAAGELIAADYPQLKLVTVANVTEGLELVRRGRADGYVDSLATIAYQLQQEESIDIKVAGTLGFDLKLSVGTRADQPLLGVVIGKALNAIGPGEIDRIVSRWLSAEYQPQPDATWLWMVLAPGVVVMLGLYLWNHWLRKVNRALAAAQAELAEKTQALERLSVTDSLTQLGNRRKLDEVLSRSVELSRRNARPLVLIMLDLDHFKRTNDSHGHQVGDQVLRQVATLISGQCRATDLPGRWGGEEFLIICPETGLDAASVLAERLRMCVEAYRFDPVQHQTISLGLAAFAAGDTPDRLLARADAALYAAKRLGRNRVAISGNRDESTAAATAGSGLCDVVPQATES